MELKDKPGLFYMLFSYFMLFVVAAIILISISVSAQTDNTTIPTTFNTSTMANCTEQLNLCVSTFNSLLEDFHNQTQCGPGFNLLRSNNDVLSQQVKDLQSQIKTEKNYKWPFWIILILFIVLIILYFNVVGKLNDEKKKIGNGRKNPRKEKDR